MIVRIFAVSAVALVVGSYIERARAGQFFVCEDGRTVEVAFNKLDEAKRTDPCVAKYYGLSVAEPALRGKAGEPVAVGGRSISCCPSANLSGCSCARRGTMHRRQSAILRGNSVWQRWTRLVRDA